MISLKNNNILNRFKKKYKSNNINLCSVLDHYGRPVL